MARRYIPDELLRLRESPLVVKPPGLPPIEEWMGPAQEHARNQTKSANADRSRSLESSTLLDQTNRRPPIDRHMSRGTANPEDIILGPPKTAFASATSLRSGARVIDLPDRPSTTRETSGRVQHGFRKAGDALDFDKPRELRSNFRGRRTDDEQDSEGWSTVKPRKSFGAEGTERFNGRMGGERNLREDRKYRDEREPRERRGFDTYGRDKDIEQDPEAPTRRGGPGRSRTEPSWFKDGEDAPMTPGERKSNGERFGDKSRSWRDKDDRRVDKEDNRDVEHRASGRWDKEREKQQERDPEWMDEPANERKQAHTQEDFQKWKEKMKAGSGAVTAELPTPKAEVEADGQTSFFTLDKPKFEPPLIMDTGPDKFFGMWAQPKGDGPDATEPNQRDGTPKPKTTGKSSRFTSFFSAPQEESLPKPVERVPAILPMPAQENVKEREDFQKLLLKLQNQSFGQPNPSSSTALLFPSEPGVLQSQSDAPPQDIYQNHRPERQEPVRVLHRDPQQSLQELLTSRSSVLSPPARPEQMLNDLVNQRQNALSQSSARTEQPVNSNAAFLMGLMQNVRTPQEATRADQGLTRPAPTERQTLPVTEHDRNIQREQRDGSASQRQRRSEAPPGLFDEGPSFQRGPQPLHDASSRPQGPPQPTQILQRPPPGLDQMIPNWGSQNAQRTAPMLQQRHIPPPPGLAGGRGGVMGPGMFPPGFAPMSGFGPPPESISGAQRSRPPPPGFMMAPPAFMAGPPMNNFQGPDGMPYGGYDARSVPTQNHYRRP